MGRCWSGPPKIPTFNLTINVWYNYAGLFPIVAPPTIVTLASLSPGDRVLGLITAGNFMQFLSVPALTDLQWNRPGGGSAKDVIELVPLSGRYFHVEYVCDVGKGFANEYRLAVISDILPVPTPIP